MPNSISNIKIEGKESVETALDVKIISKVNHRVYIIGDDTGSALLETNQELEENIVYKLLKPKFCNETFHANPKFKILKTKISLKTKALSKSELKHYQELTLLSETQETNQIMDMNNFIKCENLSESKNIEMLTLLIVTKSRDIDGKFGKYQIVTAKDCNGEKNSINIYHDKTKVTQTGKLLTFTNLKKTNFKPENVNLYRLATTYTTRIFEANENNKKKFINICLGDEKMQGIILGYENLKSYESCNTCSSKLLDNFCKKCQTNVGSKKKQDFYVTLYAQEVDSEENIVDLFSFKKELFIDLKEEEIEKSLEEIVGKTFIIEYNKPEGEEKSKLVKMYKD